MFPNIKIYCSSGSKIYKYVSCSTCFTCLQLSGGCELVVVLLDFTSGGAGELSVRCGQTVELVERSAERPGWCLARTTDQTPQQVTRWIGEEPTKPRLPHS